MQLPRGRKQEHSQPNSLIRNMTPKSGCESIRWIPRIAAAARPQARALAAEFLNKEYDAEIWPRMRCRIEDALQDLQAIMPAAPAGIDCAGKIHRDTVR